MLWIAYDLWLTRDLFQRCRWLLIKSNCCELLTIFDLQEIYSNLNPATVLFPAVVNCLRSLTYKRFIPTQRKLKSEVSKLWIAYDLWLTRDLFQHLWPTTTLQLRCELLTIFDLQEIYSNCRSCSNFSLTVVNCLRSLTYKRFIPTTSRTGHSCTRLWIAYDLWLTRDLFQQF